MEKIKILLVDDQVLMRDGLKTIINFQDDMEVVGVASDGLKCLELVEQLKPDLVLMDVRMPIMDGVEATKEIKKDYPEIKVVILTTFDDDEYIINALQYGAEGYLLKDTDSTQLTNSIRDAMNGNLLLPGKVATKLVKKLDNNKILNKEEDVLEQFSEREKEIISLMTKGYNNVQISKTLFLSEGTVKNYISNIYSKVGISERTKVILYFKNLGF